jgi:DNA processing protein
VTAHVCISRRDPRYPSLLAAVHDPPSRLWIRDGAGIETLRETCVAIVGARSCSGYGRAVARALGRDLGAAGVVVVSGLARGVDAEAHRGTLDAGGATVAVLGCGIDRDYPAAHGDLARRIVASGGAVVSEYEQGVEPAPWRFPARNRIIAGLCKAIVVVEARERSGALITADFALEGGREVLAVPGEITSALSAGTNALLRLGATPVTSAGDVFDALGMEPSAAVPAGEMTTIEADVLRAIGEASGGLDGICRVTSFTPAVVAAAVVSLELAGLIAVDDGTYRVLSLT